MHKWMPVAKEISLLWILYIPCTLSIAVYIGWASCFQVGIAAAAALCSGFLLLETFLTAPEKGEQSLARIVLIIMLGIGSLFGYQIAFGVFLLPFGIFLISQRA